MYRLFFQIPLIISCVFSGCSRKEEPIATQNPPIAQKIPKELVSHEESRTDNYFWLKDRANPMVISYLEEENQYMQDALAHTQRLQENLYYEMLNRLILEDQTVPSKQGDYYYYSKTLKDKQYPLYCRTLGIEGNEEIYLDENFLAKGQPYSSLESIRISPNQEMLAYCFDNQGSEVYTIHFKNLTTQIDYQDKIYGVVPGIEWANDNKTLFYTIYDEAKRPFQVYRHVLGSDSEEDQLIYQENDPTYRLALNKTKDKKYIIISTRSILTTESYLVDADSPNKSPKLFRKREPGLEYSLAHHEGQFIVLTNKDGASNFKLMVTSESGNWEDLIPYNDDQFIENFDVFKDFMAIFGRANGQPNIRIYHFESQSLTPIEFKESIYEIIPEENLEYESSAFRYGYTSLITPYSVLDYDLKLNKSRLVKRKEINDYDPNLYVMEKLNVPSYDGVNVPLSIIYKKDLKASVPQPLLLTGYGAYGSCYPIFFSSDRISFLDRGMIYAIAHIRGGAEMGRNWYEEGKALKKKNTFYDFIACSEFLVNQGYTSTEQLAIEGRSAGGLLIGAVLNMRPDLYKVAVAGVPFVDVITTMSDPSIPLTVNEYEEWGNPENLEDYLYMKSYSPYDNVVNQKYPHLLITAGLNDPRVAYWEPAKWTAKLRAHKTDSNLLVLKTHMSAGHRGSSGRFDYLKEKAFSYAFIIDRLGL